MTPEQLAALKAGASMEEVLAMADTPDADAEAAAAAAAAKASTAPEKPAEPTALTIEAAMAKIGELEASAEATATQLVDMTAKAQTAEAKVTELEAAATASAATITAMSAQLRPYVTQMGVALSAGVDAASLSAEALASTHADLKTKFQATYKSGKQSKSAQTTATQVSDKESAMLANAAAFQL